jgi:transposase
MGKSVLYVGLDVHKMSVDVAVAEPGPGAEVRFYGRIGGDLEALDKVTRKLQAQGAELRFAYEAGPCGYQVYRHLTARGLECLVAAPALIPRRPGDRLKNDRRDALALARLLRAGELTPIKVPDEDGEAMRDLTRAREDAICVERRARQRTVAFLLRHGRVYPGKTTWGRGHWAWLLQQVMDHPAQQIVLQEYLDAVREASARVLRLTGQIRDLVPQWHQAPFVAAYQALRGVSLIVAATVVAEVGDLDRFNNPKELMAYLGRITKTGNSHARRVLVEAAWAYRLQARVTRHLLKRQEGLPECVRQLAWKAQLRLCARYRRLLARGKARQTIVIALARELAAFLWAIGRAVAPATA